MEGEVGQFPAAIVILNGTPRAGKTSIAHALQRCMPGPWLCLGLEVFKSATPPKFQPGIGLRPGGERPDLEPLIEQLYLAMYESIAAHSRRGINVVAETTHHDHYSRPMHLLPRCARILGDLPVLVVGVRCPLDVVMQRRQATWGSGYEDDGSVPEPIMRWQRAVHVPGVYDMEVDTSLLSPEGAANLIRERVATRPYGEAIGVLASLARE
jgi:chloramphenicol 3-O phosphotransferase